METAVPFTKYDKVSKRSSSSSSSSSSRSQSNESIEVPKNEAIINNSNGPEIEWIDSPLPTSENFFEKVYY